MRHLRFSMAALTGAVLVAAVGLAALKNASETWAGGMLMLTCGIFAFGIIGAIFRGGARRRVVDRLLHLRVWLPGTLDVLA